MMNNEPELDRAQLAEIKTIMRDGFASFVAETLENMADHIKNLQAGIEQQDVHAIHIAAHSLGSNSAYLGLTRLTKLARKIEAMAIMEKKDSHKDIPAIEPLFDELQKDFSVTEPFLLEETTR